jgi:hypothetical protein
MIADWTNSPAHLDLLSKFLRGREIAQVMDWQYLKESLGEGTRQAIDRFIGCGLLVPCTTEETLDRILTVADLKPLLSARDLKASGNKAELITRLSQADPRFADQLASSHSYMKCSSEAAAILEDLEERRSVAEALAKQRCYEHLMSGDIRAAYRVQVEFVREFRDPRTSAHDYQAQETERVLNTCPDSLSHLDHLALRHLQTAVAMSKLWFDEKATRWLAEHSDSDREASNQALAHLTRAAELGGRYIHAEGVEHSVKIVFSPYDLDSCDLCKQLDGKVFNSRELPNMPLRGCTSRTGCMCELETIWDDREMRISLSLDDLTAEEPPSRRADNLVERLTKLKLLFDSGLVSPEEYDMKRQQLLDEL